MGNTVEKREEQANGSEQGRIGILQRLANSRIGRVATFVSSLAASVVSAPRTANAEAWGLPAEIEANRLNVYSMVPGSAPNRFSLVLNGDRPLDDGDRCLGTTTGDLSRHFYARKEYEVVRDPNNPNRIIIRELNDLRVRDVTRTSDCRQSGVDAICEGWYIETRRADGSNTTRVCQNAMEMWVGPPGGPYERKWNDAGGGCPDHRSIQPDAFDSNRIKVVNWLGGAFRVPTNVPDMCAWLNQRIADALAAENFVPDPHWDQETYRVMRQRALQRQGLLDPGEETFSTAPETDKFVAVGADLKLRTGPETGVDAPYYPVVPGTRLSPLAYSSGEVDTWPQEWGDNSDFDTLRGSPNSMVKLTVPGAPGQESIEVHLLSVGRTLRALHPANVQWWDWQRDPANPDGPPINVLVEAPGAEELEIGFEEAMPRRTLDADGDGIADDADNCPGRANPDQTKTDPNSRNGDACAADCGNQFPEQTSSPTNLNSSGLIQCTSEIGDPALPLAFSEADGSTYYSNMDVQIGEDGEVELQPGQTIRYVHSVGAGLAQADSRPIKFPDGYTAGVTVLDTRHLDGTDGSAELSGWQWNGEGWQEVNDTFLRNSDGDTQETHEYGPAYGLQLALEGCHVEVSAGQAGMAIPCPPPNGCRPDGGPDGGPDAGARDSGTEDGGDAGIAAPADAGDAGGADGAAGVPDGSQSADAGPDSGVPDSGTNDGGGTVICPQGMVLKIEGSTGEQCVWPPTPTPDASVSPTPDASVPPTPDASVPPTADAGTPSPTPVTKPDGGPDNTGGSPGCACDVPNSNSSPTGNILFVTAAAVWAALRRRGRKE